MILEPVPVDVDADVAPVVRLGRQMRGVRVGLRLDHSWRSYFVVVEEWTRLLELDGAEPRVLLLGERVGPQAAQTGTDLDDWSRLVEVGVVGLGN